MCRKSAKLTRPYQHHSQWVSWVLLFLLLCKNRLEKTRIFESQANYKNRVIYESTKWKLSGISVESCRLCRLCNTGFKYEKFQYWHFQPDRQAGDDCASVCSGDTVDSEELCGPGCHSQCEGMLYSGESTCADYEDKHIIKGEEGWKVSACGVVNALL